MNHITLEEVQQEAEHDLNNQEKIIKYIEEHGHISSLEALQLKIVDVIGQIHQLNKRKGCKPIVGRWAKVEKGAKQYKLYFYADDLEKVKAKGLLKPEKEEGESTENLSNN